MTICLPDNRNARGESHPHCVLSNLPNYSPAHMAIGDLGAARIWAVACDMSRSTTYISTCQIVIQKHPSVVLF